MSIKNVSSTLTRPNNSTPYSGSTLLIASSALPGSIIVPAINVGASIIRRARLFTNAVVGWGPSQIGTLTVGLWFKAPTYQNGDGGSYNVLTGSAGFIGSFINAFTEYPDGGIGITSPFEMNVAPIAPGNIFWDLHFDSGANVQPMPNQIFTLTLETTLD